MKTNWTEGGVEVIKCESGENELLHKWIMEHHHHHHHHGVLHHRRAASFILQQQQMVGRGRGERGAQSALSLSVGH